MLGNRGGVGCGGRLAVLVVDNRYLWCECHGVDISILPWPEQRSINRFVARLPSSGVGLLECWRFGSSHSNGYAKFGDRSVWPELYAHRLVVYWLHGLIPEGFEVDHLCFTRDCVNPLHLRCCPLAENREKRKSLSPMCKHGHLWAEHGYVNPKGRRVCRACGRESVRRWHARRALAAAHGTYSNASTPKPTTGCSAAPS